jgi:hypothetical protein
MKLLLEGLLAALVLVAELVGLIALATGYTTTTEAHPLEQGSFAIVASDDGEGEAYQWVEWDASSCGVRGVQRKSESSVDANFFSASEAQDCRVHIRPHLATTRPPALGRPVGIAQSLLLPRNAPSSRHFEE